MANTDKNKLLGDLTLGTAVTPVTASATAAPKAATTTAAPKANAALYGTTQSELKTNLQTLAQQMADVQATKPGDYQSAYGNQIQGLLDKMLNRPSFSYDATSDPLYQQYSDQYQRLGKNAMLDATGAAAGLTGGYGNSYAATAGNQAYQQYLQALTDKIPALQEAAYQRYRDEGDTDRANLGVLQTQENSDYGKYRDVLGDYWNDLNYTTGRYDTTYGSWENARNFDYQKEQDALAQANWQAEFDAKYGGGGGGGDGGGGGSGSKSKKITVSNGAGGTTKTSVYNKNKGDHENSAYWSRIRK